MKYTGSNQELISILNENEVTAESLNQRNENDFMLIWFKSDSNFTTIDSKRYEFESNQIVCLTEFHKLSDVNIKNARVIRFNRSFYCILDNDEEVSCKGLLFFGANNVPVIDISSSEIEIFETVFKMFQLELKTDDNLQLEMLQMMLKRFLILCTRAFKKQTEYNSLNHQQQDIIREYNYLVEKHFREKQSVKEYAEMLYKSPKTLSNLFSKIGERTPLEFIHHRILIEAKRLLIHSNQSIKEIAFEIGFEDQQSFSRFFKNKAGISPLHYREDK
ncbi:helix-turn-helix domain-containing protein [Robiginitalea sp. IMCC44478]|uniref:helix-turn-helix domain-containing protein n=1 Tax=Robiginitalea sp. IMCC44478 TaxID=3459122 RepID=UPI0040414B98